MRIGDRQSGADGGVTAHVAIEPEGGDVRSG